MRPPRKIILPSDDDTGKKIDYLEEDPEIPSQKVAVVSFLSPEKVLKQKSEFYQEEFMKYLDYDWKVVGLDNFMLFISKKYSIKIDDLLKDTAEYVKVRNDEIKKTDIHEKYIDFLLKNEKRLQDEYNEKVGGQLNVRGVKIRRVFSSEAEAGEFAKVLRNKYPNDSLVVGRVGAWLPWDPSDHLFENVEYSETGLNEMMRKHKENEINREIFFEEQKNDAIKRQHEQNKAQSAKNAAESQVQLAIEAPPVHPSEGAIRD
jgi:hypothetical protein